VYLVISGDVTHGIENLQECYLKFEGIFTTKEAAEEYIKTHTEVPEFMTDEFRQKFREACSNNEFNYYPELSEKFEIWNSLDDEKPLHYELVKKATIEELRKEGIELTPNMYDLAYYWAFSHYDEGDFWDGEGSEYVIDSFIIEETILWV
jgi:hypothetical protein